MFVEALRKAKVPFEISHIRARRARLRPGNGCTDSELLAGKVRGLFKTRGFIPK